MSGKAARRLRRLAEQATNAKHGSTTIPADRTEAYKEVPVLSNRKREDFFNRPNTTKVIKVDSNNPRAFYQQAKRMYKSGEAAAEAERLKREFRQEQLKAARQFAETIEAIVEGKGEYSALVPGAGELPHPVAVSSSPVEIKFTDWLVQNDHEIAKLLPFDVKATPEEMHQGIVTAVVSDPETGRDATFKVNKDAEFAVLQEGDQGWRMFNLKNFNGLDDYYKSIADEIHLILHLIAEPVDVN